MTTSSSRIREAGDSALLLELEWGIDPEVNARVIAIATVVREAGVAGVRAVVPTFRSVAVFFDPLVTDVALVAHVLREAQQAGPSQVQIPSRSIEVPVAYGGEYGPDLEHVAARAGISVQDVIERHASRDYRVYMLGFLPGFAYMGIVDESIAAPRRAEPRVRVPAGSVGIAGVQTGIYPREAPGGWQLIGRTPLAVFDPLGSRRRCLRPAIASGSNRHHRATWRACSAARRSARRGTPPPQSQAPRVTSPSSSPAC